MHACGAKGTLLPGKFIPDGERIKNQPNYYSKSGERAEFPRFVMRFFVNS
jgi:hypothetical protein